MSAILFGITEIFKYSNSNRLLDMIMVAGNFAINISSAEAGASHQGISSCCINYVE